jgi:HEPN domain-containing protein
MESRKTGSGREAARQQLKRLRAALENAVRRREQGRYDEATQIGYEVIEQALKTALLSVGVEPPPWVDVGPQLEENRARFLPGFQENLDIAAYAARVSWEWRKADFEVKGQPGPGEDSYDDYDAQSALETAERVLSMVEEQVAGS